MRDTLGRKSKMSSYFILHIGGCALLRKLGLQKKRLIYIGNVNLQNITLSKRIVTTT